MTAYRLKAKHSITADRARAYRRNHAVIQLRCTLTVYLLALQPLVDAILRKPLTTRRPRAISITQISSHPEPMSYGARTWTFTIVLHTSNNQVRTHTWWGRRLPSDELEEMPLDLLRRFEHMLNHAWCAKNHNRVALEGGATLSMLN